MDLDKNKTSGSGPGSLPVLLKLDPVVSGSCSGRGDHMERVVVITGAGRGIGAATARQLAGQGFSVCVNYKSNAESACRLVSEIQEMGGAAVAVQADIAIEADVVRLFNEVDRSLGTLTHLVNNAAILRPQMKVVDMTADRILQIFSTNVIGCFLCCREAIKRMVPGGAIVNVSSVAARLGSAGEYVDYAASKGAVDTLTRGLSLELAEMGIRVNGVRPGYIRTEMHADGGEPDRVERLKSQIPLRRGGEPSEVAAAIAWLLSDEASYVTGSFIDLGGGR